MLVIIMVAFLCIRDIPNGAQGLFIREAMRRSASQHPHLAETISLINTATTQRHGRVKRMSEVLEMPEHLDFRFGGKTSEGHIRLKRLADDVGSFPLYEINEHGLQEIDLPHDLLSSRAFYRQENNTGIVLVSKKSQSSHSFSLDGLVMIMDTQYVISPVDEEDESGSNHTLKQLVMTLNATDEVLEVDKGESVTFEGPPNTTAEAMSGEENLWPWVSRRYIEVAMVADFSAFLRFREYANGRPLWTLLEMYLYYGFVALSAGLRYETIRKYEWNLDVHLAPKSLTICVWSRFCPWTEDHVIAGTDKIVMGSVLPAFRRYVNGDRGPGGDHAMLFTGYRLAKPDGATGVIGVAYVGTGCSNWGVSLVHDFFNSVTSAVAAHELGHSFSAKHDNSKDSVGCKNADYYVMASHLGFPTNPKVVWHPYAFSNCSCKYIRNHLKSEKGECTKNRPVLTIRTQFIPGQYYNADTQCTLARGSGSTFCRTFQSDRQFSTMCVRMYCSSPERQSHCVGVVPLHRTSCGNQKWCERGRCVDDLQAPVTASDKCPQGDDRTISCSRDLCTTDTYINVLCCETCKNAPFTTTTYAPTTTTEYPPNCGKVCQCLITTSTILCLFRCLVGIPC